MLVAVKDAVTGKPSDLALADAKVALRQRLAGGAVRAKVLAEARHQPDVAYFKRLRKLKLTVDQDAGALKFKAI